MAALHFLSHIAFTPIVMPLLFVGTLLTSLSQDPITPGPTTADCSPRLVALMPCAPFVQGTAQRLAQSCCNNLNQLYSLQPGCLCLLLNDTTLSAFPINTTLAMQLPVFCKLQANTSACLGVPSPPSSSGSQVSLGANHNSSVAASPPNDEPNCSSGTKTKHHGIGVWPDQCRKIEDTRSLSNGDSRWNSVFQTGAPILSMVNKMLFLRCLCLWFWYVACYCYLMLETLWISYTLI